MSELGGAAPTFAIAFAKESALVFPAKQLHIKILIVSKFRNYFPPKKKIPHYSCLKFVIIFFTFFLNSFFQRI